MYIDATQQGTKELTDEDAAALAEHMGAMQPEERAARLKEAFAAR